MIAKSITIKGRGGKSGGCVVKAVEFTSGGLPGVLDSGLSGSYLPLSRLRILRSR
jgi:hypothetical protein